MQATAHARKMGVDRAIKNRPRVDGKFESNKQAGRRPGVGPASQHPQPAVSLSWGRVSSRSRV